MILSEKSATFRDHALRERVGWGCRRDAAVPARCRGDHNGRPTSLFGGRFCLGRSWVSRRLRVLELSDFRFHGGKRILQGGDVAARRRELLPQRRDFTIGRGELL